MFLGLGPEMQFSFLLLQSLIIPLLDVNCFLSWHDLCYSKIFKQNDVQEIRSKCK